MEEEIIYSNIQAKICSVQRTYFSIILSTYIYGRRNNLQQYSNKAIL